MHKADIRIGTTDHLKIQRIEIDDVTRIIWVCMPNLEQKIEE